MAKLAYKILLIPAEMSFIGGLILVAVLSEVHTRVKDFRL